ncbi:MAG: LacI family DNA-binding transcriptional regulator [Solirubrobacterales bacterium]|nr:LacI family DNA-binding transcriptional regulator [Solirubrobacterales bacterium]MBV9917599.1 LacI family DNA-binding transcriptional regulator [Solirubrobacterales bacterium]
MSPSAKRVTIREVADAVGLSPAAVSYALRGINVSEETQERVRKAASELGYEANPIARALVSGRTGTVGILGLSLEDLSQQQLVAQAGRALLAEERFALILDPRGDPDRQRSLATQLRDQHVDGLIVSPVDPADDFWPELAATLAVVSIGDALAGGAVGEVLFDNRNGIRAALEHLYSLGHRRLAVLRPPGSPTNDRPAEVIVAAEAQRLDLDVDSVSTPYQLDAATTVARQLLQAPRPPTAVFCFSDSIAYGVYAAARELGLAIPEQLSVVGYDDHPISALLAPPLTSFDWDTERVVDTAVGMVLGAIEERGRRRRRVLIEPTLRERGSTARRQ